MEIVSWLNDYEAPNGQIQHIMALLNDHYLIMLPQLWQFELIPRPPPYAYEGLSV